MENIEFRVFDRGHGGIGLREPANKAAVRHHGDPPLLDLAHGRAHRAGDLVQFGNRKIERDSANVEKLGESKRLRGLLFLQIIKNLLAREDARGHRDDPFRIMIDRESYGHLELWVGGNGASAGLRAVSRPDDADSGDDFTGMRANKCVFLPFRANPDDTALPRPYETPKAG